MRLRIVLPLAATAALAAPTGALADYSHVVTRGESLTSIAASDGVSVGTLAAANRLAPTAKLIAGSKLRIPTRVRRAATGTRRAARGTRDRDGPQRTTAQVRPPAASRYVVRRGDTLSAIAARAGISVSTLAATNRIGANAVLLAGSTLAVPARAGASAPRPRPVTLQRYVVRRGDTLSVIAARSGVSLGALATANHIHADALLLAGATILVPGRGRGSPGPARRHPMQRYVVRSGDTLSTIAARSGVSLGALATANHIHADALLLAGATILVPRRLGAPAAPAPRRYVVQPGDTLSAIAARGRISVKALAAMNRITVDALLLAGATLLVPGTPSGTGGPRSAPVVPYVVAPGDTLSGIAAHAGVSVDALAAMNRIDPNALLFAGATLLVPGGLRPGDGPPYPTAERVSASQVEQIAAANGVPGSLAAAIGWQESGFNNALVSSADARGVMQILPRTWNWIDRTLDPGTPLAPASALDNVRGGVLLLHSLLDATDGNERLAIAGYIQGLSSVRAHGMFEVTRQYVRDVLALRSAFGGP